MKSFSRKKEPLDKQNDRFLDDLNYLLSKIDILSFKVLIA